MKYRFFDSVHGATCTLVVPAGGRVFPSDGEPKVGVEHAGCDEIADLSVELDSFYCRACQWNGRVSGAWAVDCIEAAKGGLTMTYVVEARSKSTAYTVGEFNASSRWEAVRKAKRLLVRQGNADMVRWRFRTWRA
jgi:hypothetical protein